MELLHAVHVLPRVALAGAAAFAAAAPDCVAHVVASAGYVAAGLAGFAVHVVASAADFFAGPFAGVAAPVADYVVHVAASAAGFCPAYRAGRLAAPAADVADALPQHVADQPGHDLLRPALYCSCFPHFCLLVLKGWSCPCPIVAVPCAHFFHCGPVCQN